MSIVPNSLNQINELVQGTQISTGINFDLSDDTFANILGDKLDKLNSVPETFTQLMGPIGIPTGLNIEGLTDNPFKVGAIGSADMAELSLNQSEVNSNDENVIKAAGHKIEDFISQLNNGKGSVSVDDIMLMKASKSTLKAMQGQDNLSNGLGNFMKKQAANLYGVMGRTAASTVSDLLSAM